MQIKRNHQLKAHKLLAALRDLVDTTEGKQQKKIRERKKKIKANTLE